MVRGITVRYYFTVPGPTLHESYQLSGNSMQTNVEELGRAGAPARRLDSPGENRELKWKVV